jgi:hypothetical protein
VLLGPLADACREVHACREVFHLGISAALKGRRCAELLASCDRRKHSAVSFGRHAVIPMLSPVTLRAAGACP